MTTLERLDFSNVTYSKVHEFARVMVDAFRDEAVGLAMEPIEEHLDDASLPPIADYEKLLPKIKQFESRVTSLSRWLYVGMRSDWRQHMFLLRDENGRAVAGAQWSLPKYQPTPSATPSLFYRMRTLLLKGWWYLCSLFGPRTPSWESSPAGQVFTWAMEQYKCADTEERIKELEQMPVSELRNTTYPKSTCYYLHLFFVRTGQQGKGYGNQIMDHSLAYMREQALPPPNLAKGAPPKATLQAVPNARGYYKKYGYAVGGEAERDGLNGEHLVLTYYYMNLD